MANSNSEEDLIDAANDAIPYGLPAALLFISGSLLFGFRKKREEENA